MPRDIKLAQFPSEIPGVNPKRSSRCIVVPLELEDQFPNERFLHGFLDLVKPTRQLDLEINPEIHGLSPMPPTAPDMRAHRNRVAIRSNPKLWVSPIAQSQIGAKLTAPNIIRP